MQREKEGEIEIGRVVRDSESRCIIVDKSKPGSLMTLSSFTRVAILTCTYPGGCLNPPNYLLPLMLSSGDTMCMQSIYSFN